ncbi:Protein spaetzle, partial [Operophtera brumata]
LIWTSLRVGDGYSCPYGQNCGFEPAPPGRAPACAQPGLTYCLIEAGQYDIRTLLSDETRDDFTATKKTEYPYDYGPNSLPHVDQISLVNDYSKDYNKYNTRYNHDGGLALCSVRTEFITPRAALNNKGSWKYVVNMPDNMTQLVRAEICTSMIVHHAAGSLNNKGSWKYVVNMPDNMTQLVRAEICT